jgi:hypothetical protein
MNVYDAYLRCDRDEENPAVRLPEITAVPPGAAAANRIGFAFICILSSRNT